MSIITDALKQKAVYWPPGSDETGGTDFDEYGARQWASPVEIDCRWDDVQEEYVSSRGSKLTSKAIVMVDRDVKTGGVLFLGELTDVTDLSNPKNNTNAWEIERFEKNPDLEAVEFFRQAYL